MTSSIRVLTFVMHCIFTPAFSTGLFAPSVNICRKFPTQSAERLPRVRLSPTQITGEVETGAWSGVFEPFRRKAAGVSDSSATATLRMVSEANTTDQPTTLTSGSWANSWNDSQDPRATRGWAWPRGTCGQCFTLRPEEPVNASCLVQSGFLKLINHGWHTMQTVVRSHNANRPTLRRLKRSRHGLTIVFEIARGATTCWTMPMKRDD
mmetsp:Transcript_18475/g.35625  ORF Transcript_18475/g.35625 Transcript_18475/m.35625 type:complete len:208 (+) Transcript_18475:1070-1693(+)